MNRKIYIQLVQSHSIVRSALILLFLLSFVFANAAVYESVQDGKHDKSETWTPSKPSFKYSNRNDTIIIRHDVQLKSSINDVYATVIIENGASFYGSKTLSFVSNGKLINNGELDIKTLKFSWGSPEMQNNGTIELSEHFTNAAGTCVNDGTITTSKSFKNDWNGIFVNNGSIDAGHNFENKNTFTNAGTINTDKDFKNVSGATFTSSGDVTVGKNFKNYGTLTQSGATTVEKDMIADWGSSSSFTGNIEVGDDFTAAGSFSSDARMDVGDEFLVEWNVPFTNSGNLNIEGDAVNEGVFTNTGAIHMEGDFDNVRTLSNTNTIQVEGNVYADWGSSVDNSGTLFVVNDFENNGSFVNDGSFLVDGTLDVGDGTVTGSGDLCSSDGTTDPTGGAKGSVDCNICEGDGGSLPVELLSFNVDYELDKAIVEWVTATENNNSHFIVEVSRNGITFEELMRVNGAGTTSQSKSYKVYDEDATSGVQYYRLKQVDFDGSFEYVALKELKVKESSTVVLNVYPNPAQSGDMVTIETKGQVQIELYDASGRFLKSFETFESLTRIDTSELRKGLYIVKIYDGTEVASRKIHIL